MKNIGLFFACLLILQLSGCANSGFSIPPVESGLLKELASIAGTFSWSDHKKSFVYDKRDAIEKIIARRNVKETLHILVDHIDHSGPSNSLINSQKVVLGVVCYTAVTQIAYYEPIAKDGDAAKTWEGYISPDATMEELLKAKAAWQKILESHQYILL